MISKTLSFFKIIIDFKWIFTFITTSGIFSITHLEYVMKFNLHILFTVILGNVLIFYILSKRINETQKEQDKQRLKATVATAFNEFSQIGIINFESTAQYIYDLEKERKRLGVNSYTEKKLKILLSKIDLTK